MPYYPPIKRRDDAPFVADRLLAIRKQLRDEIPERTIQSSLLLATWNIRDFDGNKFKHGPRRKESVHYIAEVMNGFDLIAVQEINRNTKPLRDVLKLMGPTWQCIMTDVTEGPSGNSERMAFVYDTRKVRFRGVAGEVVLPKSRKILQDLQFARSPFIVSFQAGWFRFSLCTVHIYFGSDSGQKLERRVKEIEALAKFFKSRAKKQKDDNFILLGDFNIVSPEHKTMDALVDNGFEIPEPLQGLPTNMFGNKIYDQIAFMQREQEVQLGDSAPNAGAFNMFKSVFRTSDHLRYDADLPSESVIRRTLRMDDSETLTEADRKKYYKNHWRTWQMSDHLPLWVELKIDFSDPYLDEIKRTS